jgi:ribonucleoside-diphosphate reductase alpha chain
MIGENPFMPKSMRRIFRTAHEVPPEFHLLHQASWQQWNDSGTSKTINLRSEEPLEIVEKVYLLAWKLGIKGVTVYRDRSKSQQVIYFGIKKEREEEEKRRMEKENEVNQQKVEQMEVQQQHKGGQQSKVQQQVLKSLSSFRISQSKYVEVSETYSGGCKSCEL